ncbi:MAG TPA: branched-chain amino acid ABC transporter permease [Solirubrobacteraceae bacterium]|nr:branched-chain amino acid ABC transporter permease [Solirubrobacteraceae bacterium]
MLAVVVVFAIVLPFALNAAQLATATFVVIAAIGATGLNVVTGYAGQISLGHAAFLGVGAYTGAVLGADHGVTAFIWIPAAGVVAALLGAVVGPVALRLRGLYLAIVTLGLIFIAQHVFFNLDGLTGGPQGRAFPAVQLASFDFSPGQVLDLGGITIDSSGLYYFLGLILLAAATAFAWNLRRTRSGRAMVALREREAAAAVMGINVGRLKVTAFVVSSAMAGVSGALYGSYLSFAQPDQWSLLLSIQFIAAIIVGGLGTTAGPVLGCAVVFALPSLLKQLPFLPEEGSGGLSAGDLTSITYGLLIVAFLTLEPRGLVGIANRLRRTGNGSDVGSSVTPKLTVTTPEEAHP